jgi:hypothetical protein
MHTNRGGLFLLRAVCLTEWRRVRQTVAGNKTSDMSDFVQVIVGWALSNVWGAFGWA